MRVKGVLIDLDGTLYTNNGPIEGAREALERLDCAGISYRYITNATHKPRREVAAHLKTLGLPAEEGQIFIPTIAAAEQLRGEGVSCYPLVKGNVFVPIPRLKTGRNRRVTDLGYDDAINLERCRGNTFKHHVEGEPPPLQTFP